MQLGNPLPVLIGITMLSVFCALLERPLTLLDEASTEHARAHTLPLDGLRGLLAAAVFFHHASIHYGYLRTGVWTNPASNLYLQLGPTAVTLFFCISGYLFWRKMLEDPAKVQTSRLMPNRARRILPAYWAAICLLLLVAAGDSGFQLHQPALQVAGETASWFLLGFPFLGGPFVNGLSPNPLAGGIFWTLQLEWIFYLLLPALRWFRPFAHLVLLIALVDMSNVLLPHLHIHGRFTHDSFFFVLEFFRMFWAGFALGMLAAYGIHQAGVVRVLRSPWFALPAGSLLLLQLLKVSVEHPWYEPLLMAPFFFSVVAGNTYFGLLTSRPLRCMGAISYSFYVFHGLLMHGLLSLLDHVRPVASMTVVAYWLWIVPVGLIATLWSALSFRFIEKPFFAKRSGPRPAAPANGLHRDLA